jgi:hypothetical protein
MRNNERNLLSWEDNIKIDLEDIVSDGVNYNHQFNRGPVVAQLCAAIIFGVPEKSGNFLTS